MFQMASRSADSVTSVPADRPFEKYLIHNQIYN
jgi:hypothetical protein